MERYWLIGGGALLGVLLVASVAISLMRGETQLDPNSPEYTVQQYVRALASEDYEAAGALWSPELMEDCSIEGLALDAGRSHDRLSEARITLKDSRAAGETTLVRIGVVRTTGGGIFGPSEFESSHEYGVRQFEGQWRITGHTWPGNRCITSHFDPEPPTTITFN